MSLFSDDHISGIEDLRAYDSSVLEVASADGIDVSAKQEIATTEIGIELDEFLRKSAGGPSGYPGHQGADLTQVVVTPALKQWHTLRALALIYGDVHGAHVRGPAEGRWREYQGRSRWAAETLYRTGIGLVHRPVPMAKSPAVQVLAGTTPGATYHVKIAWRNDAGELGAASDTVITSVVSTGVIEITAVQPPSGVVSFDVFVGPTEGEISRQNETPVEVGQEWTMPETGLVEGDAPTGGQAPDWWVRNDRVLQRG